jgi:hypothetical protein
VAPTDLPAGTTLTALNGDSRTVEEWLITFQILGVVLDPFTYESSWLLETSGRILETFSGASVRICFILTCTQDEARRFLGPWTERMLVYVDPDRAFVKACGLQELPALVHIRQNLQVEAAAEGWRPEEWRAIVTTVAREKRWSRPVVPAAGDPAPYPGTPALGAPREPGLDSGAAAASARQVGAPTATEAGTAD